MIIPYVNNEVMYLRSGKIINSKEKEEIRLFITEKTALKKKHYNIQQFRKRLDANNVKIICVSSNINKKLRRVQYEHSNGFIV